MVRRGKRGKGRVDKHWIIGTKQGLSRCSDVGSGLSVTLHVFMGVVWLSA